MKDTSNANLEIHADAHDVDTYDEPHLPPDLSRATSRQYRTCFPSELRKCGNLSLCGLHMSSILSRASFTQRRRGGSMKEYQQLSWLGAEKHTAARESLVLKAVTVPVDLTNLDVKHRCKFFDCAVSGDEVFF
jgi:hypothetical protein